VSLCVWMRQDSAHAVRVSRYFWRITSAKILLRQAYPISTSDFNLETKRYQLKLSSYIFREAMRCAGYRLAKHIRLIAFWVKHLPPVVHLC
jgi:hypothetical protein